MNTITKTRQFAGAALFAAAAAILACPFADASFIEMGLNRDKMPVDKDEVLHTFERARRLQFFEMRELQATSEVVPLEEAIIEVTTVDANETSSVDEDDEAIEEVDMTFAVDISEEAQEAEVVVEGRTEAAAETGPRGGRADLSPGITPTEISFMIVSSSCLGYINCYSFTTSSDSFKMLCFARIEASFERKK
jgi:hypothetical protein